LDERYPDSLAEMKARNRSDPSSRVLFGSGFAELQMLHIACYRPTDFPVHILADEKLVHLVKAVRPRWMGDAGVRKLRAALSAMTGQK